MGGFFRRGFWMLGGCAAIACALLVCAVPAFSGERTDGGEAAVPSGRAQQNSDLRNLSIEQLMEIEVGTVVSASRYRQNVSDAPASVTIITAEDIRRYGYRTLADILQSVRGFSTSYDRSYSYVGVRGFGRPGDPNTRILLLVDGHRINDAIYDSAPIGTEFPLDIDLIARVEVARGPGSSLYGSNAFFGVVNIITRAGGEGAGTEVSAVGGSHDAYGGRLTYERAARDTGSVLLSASGAATRGSNLYFREYDQANPLADLRAANNGVAAECDYERSRGAYLAYETGRLRLAALYGERMKGIPTAAFGTDFNDTGTWTKDQRAYLDLQYTGRSGGGEYVLRGYVDRSRSDANYLYGGIVTDDGSVGSWYGGEARVTPRVLGAHRLVAGAEYEVRARLDQWNEVKGSAPVVYLDDHRSSRIWAVYAQDEITLSPALLLYAGIRRDQTSTFGGETSPRLSAVLIPFEQGRIKLLYGRAFRAPNAYELYYEAPPLAVSNPSLRPEVIDTYELVYEHDLGSGLRTTASVYRYNIHNLITQTYDTSTDTATYRNLARAEANGAELEVRRTWEGGADVRASYAYQKTRDPSTNEPLPNAPLHLAKLNGAVPLLGERLWAGIEEQYTSSRTTLAGQRIAGFFITNVTLRARDRRHACEIALSVYNLFDRRYADPVSIDLFPLDAVQQDGRTVRVKVTYAF